MQPIQKVDHRLQRTAYGTGAILFGLPFLIAGLPLALGGFGLIPLPGEADVPPWVIGLCGLTFALAGLLLSGHGVRGIWNRRAAHARALRHPNRPWYADYPWQPGGIHDAPGSRTLYALFGALLLTAFMVPFNWVAWFSGEESWFVRAIVGLFDLVLLAVALNALYRLAQLLKYGRTRLGLAQLPFTPGGRLRLSLAPNRHRRLHLTLRYIEERVETREGSEGGQVTSQQYYTHHNEGWTLEPDPREAEVLIERDLPPRPEWTTRLTADPSVVYWELVVEADEPGIDFRTTFPLPVYVCPAGLIEHNPRFGSVRRRRALRIPYLFEVSLALLLFGIGFTGWIAFSERPGAWRKLLPAPPSEMPTLETEERPTTPFAPPPVPSPAAPPMPVEPGTLETIAGIDSNAMAIEIAPDGRPWSLTKYSLDRFDDGEREGLLDTQRYRELFEHKVNALSALTVTGVDEAWVASWYGELFHYHDGQWQERLSRDRPLRARIHALARSGPHLYLAGREGVWRYRLEDGALEPVEALPKGSAEALASDDAGNLCTGIGRGLHCLEEGEWRHRGDAPAAITALLPDADGRWWVGTRDGLYRLDHQGGWEEFGLRGSQITGIAVDGDDLWAATWDQGLQRRWGDEWLGVETESLSDIAIDPRGNLWLAAYGAGVQWAETGGFDGHPEVRLERE